MRIESSVKSTFWLQLKHRCYVQYSSIQPAKIVAKALAVALKAKTKMCNLTCKTLHTDVAVNVLTDAIVALVAEIRILLSLPICSIMRR